MSHRLRHFRQSLRLLLRVLRSSRAAMAQREEDLARFVCWKHSWRGKYRRVVVLRAQSLATLELSAEGKETNAWSLVHNTDENVHALKKGKAGVLESVKPLGSPVDAKCGRDDQEFSIAAKADEKVR